jgi:hypothetical protein
MNNNEWRGARARQFRGASGKPQPNVLNVLRREAKRHAAVVRLKASIDPFGPRAGESGVAAVALPPQSKIVAKCSEIQIKHCNGAKVGGRYRESAVQTVCLCKLLIMYRLY